MKISKVGEGKVYLIAGGGKVYADIAARFCHSNKSVDELIISPYNKKIVENIINAGHLAALEFDNFIFGIEGYSRVTEVQLVRKRLASYMISSGRDERHGKREFDIVLPDDDKMTNEAIGCIDLDPSNITVRTKDGIVQTLASLHPDSKATINMNCNDILELLENFYGHCLELGVAEEDARYMKPQATAFKAVVSMNSHSLLDWFKIRCCENAQKEIRGLAWQMLRLCKSAAPDVFANAGPSCVALGFCPENNRQNPVCKETRRAVTLDEAKTKIYGKR